MSDATPPPSDLRRPPSGPGGRAARERRRLRSPLACRWPACWRLATPSRRPRQSPRAPDSEPGSTHPTHARGHGWPARAPGQPEADRSAETHSPASTHLPAALLPRPSALASFLGLPPIHDTKMVRQSNHLQNEVGGVHLPFVKTAVPLGIAMVCPQLKSNPAPTA